MPKETPSSHNNGAEIADLILIAAKRLKLDLEMISSEFMQCHWLNNLDLNNADAMVEKLKSIDLERIGQGRENAKTFLKENPSIAHDIEDKIRASHGLDFDAEMGGDEDILEA